MVASTISARLNRSFPNLLYTPFNTLLEVTRPTRRKSSLSSPFHFHIKNSNSNPKLCSVRTVLTRVCGDGGGSGAMDDSPQQKASSVIPKLPFVFQVSFSLSAYCQCIMYTDWRSFSKQWFLDVYLFWAEMLMVFLYCFSCSWWMVTASWSSGLEFIGFYLFLVFHFDSIKYV